MAEGEFAFVTERLENALALSGQPVKRGTMAHEHIVYMMMVDSLAISEDAAGIAAHAPKLVELAARDEHAPYLAIAHRAQGVECRLNGELERAEKLLLDALGVFEARAMSWQAGRTLYELGKLEQARDSGESARGYYDRALDAFERVGAKPFIERAQTALGAGGG